MTGIRPSSRTKRIIAHLADGLGPKEVAHIVGCTESNVVQCRRKYGRTLGLAWWGDPLKPEHMERLQAYAKQRHVTLATAARELLAAHLNDSQSTNVAIS